MKVFFLCLALGLTLCLPAESRAESCMTADCHAEIGVLKSKHQPVADEECLSCHEQVGTAHPSPDGGSFRMVEQGAALCYQCHDEMGKKRGTHSPVQEGDCQSCHDPHGSDNRFMLEVGEDRSELCFGCHDAEPFEQEFIHGPVGAGACNVCHSPHQSVQKSLLKLPVRELCMQCHQDFADQMNSSTIIHPPVKTGVCTDCHSPHGSANRFIIKKKMPDICFDCHAGVAKEVAGAKVKHLPVEREGSCGNCHSTHYSNSEGLLLSDEKGLCLGCHDADKLGSPPLANIAKQLKGKSELHGPIKEERCAPCHNPHGSEFFRLLRGAYPVNLYFPYQEGSYNLCLQCHEKNLLRFETTTLYTKFRNGNRNLHFVHVVDKRKGRTCRLCHEAHASDGRALISEKGSQFGDWNLPINFKPTGTGGSCAPGCHRPYKYDRDNPAEYK